MKKKVLSALLATAMVATVVAGCGSNSGTDEPATTGEGESADVVEGEGTDTVATDEIPAVGDDTNVTIWVAEEVSDFTQAQVDAFKEANPEYEPYNVTIESVGEGDAAGNMITDVQSGADIYGFAQDQIARLVAAGALQQVSGDYATWIDEQNDAGAAGAAKVGGTTYAFPITSDNGYFLYYDKSVISDPSTMEQIIADCEAAGKNFYFDISNGWYQTAFFFGTGCELTYDTDDEGNFTGCNIDYASEKGVVALKEIAQIASSSSFQNGSSVDNASNFAAIVDGTWDSEAAKKALGDNYACAKLPTFEGSDGNTYQLSGFGGFKLLGIKPQEDLSKLMFCYDLAQYLTSADVQLARYQEKGWGPSNVTAQSDSAVQADEALSALAEQLAFAIPQGNYPDQYWSRAESLGDDVKSGNINTSTSDDDLMSALETFQTDCQSYAQ
ncbi:MAG: extracellular solute-binding protein [Lachnospiraceae bacterium]|nr:extracellular solute-binding protein [Lachnospiraceae bacterium]